MKCNKIICIDKKPKDKKLFFGDFGNYMRIDQISYPIFKKLYEHSEANTWFTNEIDYSADGTGFKELPEYVQRMFKFNISYQTLMDSGVTNIFDDIAKVVSITELQYLYKRISIEESIHATSYSNGLDAVFGNKASETLDLVYTDDFIKRRLENEVNGATDFINKCIIENKTDDEAKKSLLTLLAAAYLLEGVKFPFSFFVTWTINKTYNNAIQGFSRALKLIAHDEMTFHTVTGKTVLNMLRKDKYQGFKHLFDDGWFSEMFQNLLKITVEQECQWNEYLLKDGDISGYNKAIGEHFIKYWAMYRAKDIYEKSPYNEKKSEIIEWYNNYRSLNGTTTALQEAEATNYQKGKLMNDLDRIDNLISV